MSRWHGVWLAVLVAACGDGGDPVASVLQSAKEICGDAFEETLEARTEVNLSGCDKVQSRGSWWGRVRLGRSPDGKRPVSVEVRIGGASADVETVRGRALAVVGPLLDSDQRDAAKWAASRLFRELGGAGGMASHRPVHVGNAIIVARTEIELDRPWERTVIIRVSFSEQPGSPSMSEVPPVPDAELQSTMGRMTDAVVKKWETFCRDEAGLTRLLGVEPAKKNDKSPFPDSVVPHDRWTRGDMWLRCYVKGRARLIIDATWGPVGRHLLYARVLIGGEANVAALPSALDELVKPLLNAEQIEVLDRATRSSTTGTFAEKVRVAGMHVGDTHEVEIRAWGQ